MENHNKSENIVDSDVKSYYTVPEQSYMQPEVAYVPQEATPLPLPLHLEHHQEQQQQQQQQQQPPQAPMLPPPPAPPEAAPYVPPPDAVLKSQCIWYLDRQILYDYARLELVPKDRVYSGFPPIKINHLALMAYTDLFRFFDQSEDEDMKIITDFEAKDLQMVADFVMDGILPIPMTTLLDTGEVPEEIAQPFFAFGIDLLDLGRSGGKAFVIKKVKKVKVKKERHNNDYDHFLLANVQTELSIKSELMEDDNSFVYDNESRDYYDDDDDYDYKPKKNRYDRYSGTSESSEDTDWEPEKHYRRKRNYSGESEDDPWASRSSGKKVFLTRQEKNINRSYRDMKKMYGDSVNVNIPSREAPDRETLKNYELPRPLNTYVSPPNPELPSTNTYKADQKIPCTKCSCKFINQMKLNIHDLKAHNDHYQCSFCTRPFPLHRTEEFMVHIFRHDKMDLNPFECIHCGFSTFIYRTMVNHVTRQGPYHTGFCFHCKQKCHNHNEFKDHLKFAHPMLPQFICSICGAQFLDGPSLESHKIANHDGVIMTRKGTEKRKKYNKPQMVKRVVCDICGKSVTCLINHKAIVHCKDDPQECNLCQKVFRSPRHLDAHQRNAHKKFPCDLCGMMVTPKHKTRHYQQYHVDPYERKYKCDHCGKGFASNNGLKDHINTHTGERPYVCKFCGKTFASTGNHRMHVRTSHLGHKRSK